jgi:hypothetical protein
MPSLSEIWRVVDQLAALIPSLTPSVMNLDKVLTPEECAAWLGVEVKTLNGYAARKIVPAMKLSKNTYRYHPRTILKDLHNLDPAVLKARAVRRGAPRKPLQLS